VPSRDNKARAAAPVAAPVPGNAVGGSPVGPLQTPNPASAQPVQPGTHGSRRSLKNWRVRSRLLLLIIIPTLTAVVLGGFRIVSSAQSALAYQRVEQLANLSYYVTGLSARLEDERDQTIEYIGEGSSGRAGCSPVKCAPGSDAYANRLLVLQYQGFSQPWVGNLKRQISAIGNSYPVQIQDDAADISALLNRYLPHLRVAATTTQMPALVVLGDYTYMIDNMLAIDDNINLGSGDQALATDVRALSLVSRIAEETSEQRALLAYAYSQGSFGPGVLSALTNAQAEENANILQYDVAATPQQVTLYNSTVTGSQVDYANQYEDQAIAYGQAGRPLVATPNTPNQVWGAFATGTIGDQRIVEQDLVTEAITRASALHRSAIITASVVGGVVLVVLLLALLLITIVGRSMVRPLRRLRSGALEVAGVRLPETVRRMSESDGAGLPLDVEPIDVDSSDEIGEVARAFDQVHREALRLAANEAALRGNVNAMFVNLSRRSQSLVERQIRLIDDLEQGEQDPDRLASLFQMDHLATRMRRNSENLLVLAGHEATRRWNQPVSLVDVLRAAVSEIEQYERVTLNVQPGIAVRGHAVNDVVHLLAELAENATSFSSAETPVVVSGHLLSSGGVLLDITDQGVGMGAEEMAHANWRLDNPPVVDVAVSRRMGLFVVARLAARHGVRVRLRPAAAGGLTALIWLPDEVVSQETEAGAPGMRRLDPSTGAMAALPSGANGTAEDILPLTEEEVTGARAPQFAPFEADTAGAGGLGPRRVPGAGPHPGTAGWGSPATTSPLPVFRTGSQPDAGGAPESEEAEQLAGSAAASFQPAEGFGTGPMPVTAFGPDSSPLAASFGAPATPAADSAPATADVEAPDLGSLAQPATFAPALLGQSSILGQASSASGVVLPPADHVATENRLPIFEAVESDWFRRGRSGLGGWPAQQEAPEVPEVTWTTPSDRGWEAAAAVSSPSTGGTTTAGLPKRVPQANLVPGAATAEPAAPAPARSAAATRERFASFQRGIREGRAATSPEDGQSDGDDGSR
jgi:signal transduction histidine kinase